MKRFPAIIFGRFVAVGFLLMLIATETDASTKEVMKFKLHYAQGVLEAIATENFSLLQTNAHKLKNLSQQADWQVRQTAEYQRLTQDFARAAGSLMKAASEKNTDAATVAYFQMTVSCVSCHQHLRGAREAHLNIPEIQRSNEATVRTPQRASRNEN